MRYMSGRLVLPRACHGTDCVQPWQDRRDYRPEQLCLVPRWHLPILKRRLVLHRLSCGLVLSRWCLGADGVRRWLVPQRYKRPGAERLHHMPGRLRLPDGCDERDGMRTRHHRSDDRRGDLHQVHCGFLSE